MRARIVPRFENAARDLFSSKPTRGYVYIYLKRARFVETKPIGRIFPSPPLFVSLRVSLLLSPPLSNTAASFCRRFGIVSRIHGIIKSHDSKALLAHGLCLVYLARCHGQIIQSRCTWRLLMLVKPASHGYRSIRTRE